MRKFALICAAAVAAFLVLGVPSAAFAGKPGGGSGQSTISVKMVVDNNSNGLPNYNDTITFNVPTTSYKTWVELRCYQNGASVYAQSAGFFAGYPWAPNYQLASAYWTGGAANCSAVYYTESNSGKRVVLSTLAFGVAA